jgi:hypothetical protein
MRIEISKLATCYKVKNNLRLNCMSLLTTHTSLLTIHTSLLTTYTSILTECSVTKQSLAIDVKFVVSEANAVGSGASDRFGGHSDFLAGLETSHPCESRQQTKCEGTLQPDQL